MSHKRTTRINNKTSDLTQVECWNKNQLLNQFNKLLTVKRRKIAVRVQKIIK